MVTIKFNKKDNEISMTRMPVEDDLVERNSQNRFWLSSRQGIIAAIIIVVFIVGFSVIKHKRSISSQYDNERYHYLVVELLIFPVESLYFITENPTMITAIVITKMIPCNFRFNKNLFREFLSTRSSSTGILVIEISLSFLLNFIVTIRYISE